MEKKHYSSEGLTGMERTGLCGGVCRLEDEHVSPCWLWKQHQASADKELICQY